MNENEEQAKLEAKAFEKPVPGAIDSDGALVYWVQETVKRLDASSNPDTCDLSDPSLQVACFLIAASIVGTDELLIGKLFGFDEKHVAEWARNLRKNGLWLPDGTVVHEHWFEFGGTAGFLMDLMVAQGLLKCWIDPLEGRVYETMAGRHITETN